MSGKVRTRGCWGAALCGCKVHRKCRGARGRVVAFAAFCLSRRSCLCGFCVVLHSALASRLLCIFVTNTKKSGKNENRKKFCQGKFAPGVVGVRHLLVGGCFLNAAGRGVALLRSARFACPGVVSWAVCWSFNRGRRPM